MDSLKTRFDRAVVASKSLAERPDNATLLQIYALYKQASAGNADGDRPALTDFIGRAKWDAWKALEGTGGDDAMHRYVELIASLE